MAKFKLQWPFIIAVLAVLIVVGVGGAMYSETSPFCGSCHEMKQYYDTWKVSSHGPEKLKGNKDVKHGEVGCHSCHSWPGLGGYVKTKMVGVNEVIKHVTNNYKTPIQGEPVEERCLECHNVAKINETATHKIPHKKHEELGLKCMDCHAGMVHGHNGEGEVKPSHETCIKCHDTQDSNACATCHKW
jgi:nitrate/TMAO reductase-like tetraheme cytochrome c subunit